MSQPDVDPKFKEKSAKEFQEAIESGKLYEELKPEDDDNKNKGDKEESKSARK
jgi:hypothetical protein